MRGSVLLEQRHAIGSGEGQIWLTREHWSGEVESRAYRDEGSQGGRMSQVVEAWARNQGGVGPCVVDGKQVSVRMTSHVRLTGGQDNNNA